MSTLNLNTSVVIYDDGTATNNPYLRLPDWTKNFTLNVSNPQATKYLIPPSGSLVAFSGVDTTTIDGTTVFATTLSPLSNSTYRMSWTAGTFPGFRTDRTINLSGQTVTVTINNNSTATLSVVSGFAAVVVGDTVFIPGPVTGDVAGPFNVLNQGTWQVIAASATAITLTRPPGVPFSGVAESVAVTAQTQILAYSAAGVSIGDKLEITGGFSPATWGNYTVSQVTARWVEFSSATPLPLESGIMPNTNVVFYNKSKRFVRIESDQDCTVRFNGDTSGFVRLSPLVAGDPNNMSLMEKIGPTWSLTLVNRSAVYPMNVLIISAE